MAGTLTRFDGEGNERWTRRGDLDPPGDFESPAAITLASAAGDLLIHERMYNFYLADPDGRVVKKFSFESESPERPMLAFIAPAFANESGEVQGLAFYRPLGGGDPVAGVVHARLDGTGWRGPQAEIPVGGAEFIAFTLDLRMIAPFERGVALLVVGTAGKKHEVRLVSGESVRVVPLDIGDLDAFPATIRPGPGTMGAVHQLLRRLRLPLGIYQDRSALFLLVGGPGDREDQRRWELVSLDLETGRAKQRLVLPTTAEEVGVSPGSENWILLEKSVQGVEGVQRASSALRIPATWFHEVQSPLIRRPAGDRVLCKQ